MHAFTILALGASAISTVNATTLKARTPIVCLFGFSFFGGCQIDTTPSTTPNHNSNGPCADGAASTSTYVAYNGDVYGTCSGTDFTLYDISTTYTDSNNACADACSGTVGCVAATWDTLDGQCYLKDHQPSGSEKSTSDSVFKISAGASTTIKSTTAKLITTTIATTTPRLVTQTTTSSKTTTTTSKTTTTTSRTTTTTTTSSLPKTTTSAAPIVPTCGVAGYDKSNPAASRTDFSGTYGTFSSCKTFCEGSQSFAVGGDACLCYPAPVANNVNISSGSQYLFYDMSCAAPAATTVKTTFATTVKTTTPLSTVKITTTTPSTTVKATTTKAPLTTSAMGCPAPVTVTVTVTAH